MSTEPGIDHPTVDGEALVTLPARGISVSSRVESVDGVVLSLRPSVGGFAGGEVVAPGNVVDVLWQRPEDQRSVSAEVLEIEDGTVVRWRLRMTGRAEISQRRNAVRARVTFPVRVVLPAGARRTPDAEQAAQDEPLVGTEPVPAVEPTTGTIELVAATVDLSEAGARIVLAAPDVKRLEPGTPLQLSFDLEDGPVEATGEVIRVALREERWFVSLRFLGLEERQQDRIRRRVFQALREERARLAG